MLLIQFAVYLSGIFKEVETELEGCMTTSFTNNYEWLEVADSVKQLY